MRSLPPLSAVVDALRRPEHTGAQRCLPCTVLNLVLLAVGVLGLARRRRRGGALALAAVGSGAIWLRGYVVPYTPRFAPRLVAHVPLLDEFVHAGDEQVTPDATASLAVVADESTDGTDSTDDSTPLASGIASDASRDDAPDAGDAILDRLFAAGVLTERDDGALALSAAARDRWHAEIESLSGRPTEELATEALAVTPTASRAETVDGNRPGEEGRWIALGDGDSIAAETWLSRPVAIAEVAAVRALGEFDLASETRLAAARPLRMFLDTCPDCGGRVEETTTATCCGGVTNPRRGPQEVLACEDCGERLFTFP